MVGSEEEFYEILLENYVKTLEIEARTLHDMLARDLLPAVSAYSASVAANAAAKKSFMPALSTASEEALVTALSGAYESLSSGLEALKDVLVRIQYTAAENSMQNAANMCLTQLLPLMDTLRKTADTAEAKIPDTLLPYPTYDQLLFSV